MKHGAVASLLLFAACGVGDDADLDPTPNPTSEERLCADEYSVTGTFALGESPPDLVNNETQLTPADGIPDIQGCWPTGNWRFTVARIGGDCSPAATPPSSFEFRVDFDDTTDPAEPRYGYVLLAPATDPENFRLGVSQGGGGLCEGGLEIYSADGKEVWNIQPALNDFNVSAPLDGVGEFSRFTVNQNPSK